MNNQPVKQKVRGRPSKYTETLADELFERLGKGEPLAKICRDPHMPEVRTVSDWKVTHPEFSARFVRAREEGFDAIANDCLTICDDGNEDPASRRVRVETRLKLLAKWDPKRYGDKLDVEAKHTGAVRIVLGGNADE